MLTLSFIHNFAPRKFKPKTMDRKTKAFSGKLPGSSPSRIPFSSKEEPPKESLVSKDLVLKNCTRGGIMSVSAVPNAESNKDLVVDNPNL